MNQLMYARNRPETMRNFYMTQMVENYIECDTCNACNNKTPYKCSTGYFPVPSAPFIDGVINFTDMGVDNKVKVDTCR